MVYYPDSETVIYGVLGGCCGLLVIFCIVQYNIVWFRNCCRSIGYECGVSALVAPEDTLRRKPTAAELLHAPPHTKINDTLESMVQGPPITSPYTGLT